MKFVHTTESDHVYIDFEDGYGCKPPVVTKEEAKQALLELIAILVKEEQREDVTNIVKSSLQ